MRVFKFCGVCIYGQGCIVGIFYSVFSVKIGWQEVMLVFIININVNFCIIVML